MMFAQAVFNLGAAPYMCAITIHAYLAHLNLDESSNEYEEAWKDELQMRKSFQKPTATPRARLPIHQ
jgi:hypothetical protein